MPHSFEHYRHYQPIADRCRVRSLFFMIALWVTAMSSHAQGIALQQVDDYRWDEVVEITQGVPVTTTELARANFGQSIVTDGNWAIVGAPQSDTERSGRLYLFRANQNGRPWALVKPLEQPERSCQLGTRMALDGDWLVALPGFPCSPYLYHRNAGGPNNWGFVKTLTDPVSNDPRVILNSSGFGDVALSGDILLRGAPLTRYRDLDDSAIFDVGRVWVYERNAGGQNNWGQIGEIAIPDNQLVGGARFGLRLALDGNQLLIGSGAYPLSQAGEALGGVGRAWLFERSSVDPTQWALSQTFFAPPEIEGTNSDFARGVGISGDHLAIGGDAGELTPFVSGDGAVFLWFKGSSGWQPNGQVVGATDTPDSPSASAFGTDLRMTGNLLLIGQDEGVFGNSDLWLFRRPDTAGPVAWSLASRVQPSSENDREFGAGLAVALAGSRLLAIAGDYAERLDGFSQGSGHVYFYEYDDGLFRDSFE